MKGLLQERKTFKNFPTSRYTTDVTFQQLILPLGTHEDAKKNYTRKYKLYGLKVEVSVALLLLATFRSPFFPVTVSDIDIVYNELHTHNSFVRKKDAEIHIEAHGPYRHQYENV